MWVWVIDTVCHRKPQPKSRSAILTKIFWIKPSFHTYFSFPNCSKGPIIHIIFIILKEVTALLTQFVSLPTSYSSISDLVNTTCTNPILWLNLSYKGDLKWVNTTKILRMNLNYKKTKNVLIPSINLFPTWTKKAAKMCHNY